MSTKRVILIDGTPATEVAEMIKRFSGAQPAERKTIKLADVQARAYCRVCRTHVPLHRMHATMEVANRGTQGTCQECFAGRREVRP